MQPENKRNSVVLDDVRLSLGTQQFRFDCTMPEGAVTAIAGPSGSGKSTLLNLVAGFERPAQGRVMIADVDMSQRHPAERPVSLVFQDNNLFAHLDLFTNVGLGIDPGLKLAPADKEAVSSALARVGLGGFERRMPGTLSGGERQRTAFARALVRRKPVLLLDEPFAALDPGLRNDMADLLAELHRETGNTVLIVSHDPEEVERLADHLLFMDNGTIVLDCPVSDFRNHADIPALGRFLKR